MARSQQQASLGACLALLLICSASGHDVMVRRSTQRSQDALHRSVHVSQQEADADASQHRAADASTSLAVRQEEASEQPSAAADGGRVPDVIPLELLSLPEGIPLGLALALRGRALAAGAVNKAGLAKLNRARTALTRLSAGAFFTLIDQSGFTPSLAGAMAKFQVTLLVPSNTALKAFLPKWKKLSKSQQQQLLGYHVLNGNLPSKFLWQVPGKSEFGTADYSYTVAKFSGPKQNPVSFSNPGASAAMCAIQRGDVYTDTPAVLKRTVYAHLVTGVLTPPKYN